MKNILIIACLLLLPADAALSIRRATVQVSVKQGDVTYIGTGTAISPRRILTCAHTFRGTSATAPISVAYGDQKQAATIIKQDNESDLSLLSVVEDLPHTLPVAEHTSILNGEAVAASYHTGAPTLIECRIVAVGRLLGPENLETSGMAAQGQSGGGLFVDQELAGVCLGTNPGDNRTLFTGVPAIQRLLEGEPAAVTQAANATPVTGFVITETVAPVSRGFVITETVPAAAEPSRPRYPRVLMLHAKWCGPCLSWLGSPRAWLAAAGWEISKRDRAHVQLIDVDEDAGAMQRWNVTNLPTFILVEDGQERKRHTGLATGQTIVDLFNKPAATAVTDPVAVQTPIGEVRRVLDLLPAPKKALVDLGCGPKAVWVIEAAKKGWKAIGIEIDPAHAEEARQQVEEAGLSHLATIVTGDALTTNVEADVAVCYHWQKVLDTFVPKLKTMDAWASYQHKPNGIESVKSGDSWISIKPSQVAVSQRPYGVWEGVIYYDPPCGSTTCGMCNSLRQQIARSAAAIAAQQKPPVSLAIVGTQQQFYPQPQQSNRRGLFGRRR